MALKQNIGDREYDKFTTNSDGDTAIRTTSESTVMGGANELAVDSDGAIKTTSVERREILELILNELRMLNLHMEMITGSHVQFSDLNGDR